MFFTFLFRPISKHFTSVVMRSQLFQSASNMDKQCTKTKHKLTKTVTDQQTVMMTFVCVGASSQIWELPAANVDKKGKFYNCIATTIYVLQTIRSLDRMLLVSQSKL